VALAPGISRSSDFVVELPKGFLTYARARRHARAVLQLAREAVAGNAH